MSSAKKNTVLFLLVLLVPPLIMVPAMFFLYPYIESEKYENVVEQVASQWGDVETEDENSPLDRLRRDKQAENKSLSETTEAYKRIQQELQSLQRQFDLKEQELSQVKDSLNGMITGLEATVEELENKSSLNTVNNVGVGNVFADRAKSLFNLEDEELAPILMQMNDDLLLELYDVASTMQRQKLLRCLTSEKAAKIVTLAL
jgi:flagellar motility protein MotE (MotC chaperone)